MGEADRYIDHKGKGNFKKSKIFTLGDSNNAVMAIITVNIIFFLFILISRLFYLYTHQGQGLQALEFDALRWFSLPANLVSLSEKPWTILTFMFSHGGLNTGPLILTMLSNMLWLWAFAYILQSLSGNRYIFPVYIYGSLAGALCFIIACYSFPSLKTSKDTLFLNGSSTGTMALAVAVSVLSPNYKIFKNIGSGISVWILTLLYLVIAFMSALKFNNANSIAVLGSAVAGFLFVYLLQKGKDGSKWMINLYTWCGSLFKPAADAQAQTKDKIFYNTGDKPPYKKQTTVTQQRLDELLDKISQQGYHFLTDEEKAFLKRASEEEL